MLKIKLQLNLWTCIVIMFTKNELSCISIMLWISAFIDLRGRKEPNIYNILVLCAEFKNLFILNN